MASKSREVASVDGEPPISLASLEKADEPQNDQASLAAVKPEAFDRHTLEALKRLYRELHPLYIPAENS